LPRYWMETVERRFTSALSTSTKTAAPLPRPRRHERQSLFGCFIYVASRLPILINQKRPYPAWMLYDRLRPATTALNLDSADWRERTQCMHWGVDVFHDHCRWRWRRAERAASASLLHAGPPQPPPLLRLMPSLVPHQPVPRWAEGCCLLMAAARHALRPI
jgi:hypothetical protein